MALSYKVDAKKKGFKFLTQEQCDLWMEKGYLIIRGGVPPESIQRYKDKVWTRLGMDPNDNSTWTREEIHMGVHKLTHVKDFAPKVWGAMCELLGGEERIEAKHGEFGDGFIANLGNKDYDPNGEIDPRTFDNWHVDGDWFRHFLDTECQALETLILWSDVDERGGPTYICPDGIKPVAEWLLQHPEGADTLLSEKGERLPAVFVRSCHDFVKLTGKTGDVFLAHQIMPHSRSRNFSRKERFITNPEITLKEPQNFNRENPDDFSLLELKTLNVLGLDRLDFKATGQRKRFYPRTKARRDAECLRELQFLKEHEEQTGEKFDTFNKNGEIAKLGGFRFEGYDLEGNRLVPYPWNPTPEEVEEMERKKNGQEVIKVGPQAPLLIPGAPKVTAVH